MPVRRGETLTKCLHGDNRNMKARQYKVFPFMLIYPSYFKLQVCWLRSLTPVT